MKDHASRLTKRVMSALNKRAGTPMTAEEVAFLAGISAETVAHELRRLYAAREIRLHTGPLKNYRKYSKPK